MVTERGVRFRVGFLAVVFAWSGLRIAGEIAGAAHDPVLSPLRAAGLGSIVLPVLAVILALDVMSLVILIRRRGSAAWLIADVALSCGVAME